jgi:capsular exopolysaccharide synthesis family protein
VAAQTVKAVGAKGLTTQEFLNRSGSNTSSSTNLLRLTVTNQDRQLAARLATAYAQQFIRYTGSLQSTSLTRIRSQVQTRIRELRKTPGGRRSAEYKQLVARLQALGVFAASQPPTVSLVRPATGAVLAQPRIGRNLGFGFILGAAIGIVLAFSAEAFDRRLRSPDEVVERLSLPLLGHVAGSALGRSFLQANGGDPLAASQFEAFHILRANLDLFDVDDDLGTILVTSALPREGKSTVASSLAAAYQASGRRVLLIETDLRRPSLAKRLGLPRYPGLRDYLAGAAGRDDVVEEVVLPQRVPVGPEQVEGDSRPALACIPAGVPAPNSSELLRSKRYRDLLDYAATEYEKVILDAAPLLSVVDTREMLPHVDGILLCVRVAHAKPEQVSAAKTTLDRVPNRPPTGVVVTGLSGRELDLYGYDQYSYGYNEAS